MTPAPESRIKKDCSRARRFGMFACFLTLAVFLSATASAEEPETESTATLVDALGQEGDAKEQVSAAKKLAQVGSEDALAALALAVFSHPTPVASACLAALARHHPAKGLEVALQCMDAPAQRCSPPMKKASAGIAKALWKKLTRTRAAFPQTSLSYTLEITAHASIKKQDRWLRHIHAEILEALVTDPLVEVGEEVDLFSKEDAASTWAPRPGIRLIVRGSIQAIKRKSKSGGNFQYNVKMSTLEVTIGAIKGKGKGKGKRISSISGTAQSEDEDSLESRVIRLALGDAARKLATKIHIWTRGKEIPLEDPL